VNAARSVSWRRASAWIGVGIVAGGIVVGVISTLLAPSPYGLYPAAYHGVEGGGNYVPGGDGSLGGGGNTQVIGNGGAPYSTGTTVTTTTTTYPTQGPGGADNATQGTPAGSGGLIEFSSQVALQSDSPQQTASGVVALAYAVGGYVAYQSTYASSANVVVRVPAGSYQRTLSKIEALGTVQALTSNSNDVRVQYTDLNATLLSLQTEQGALLRLLNESTSVNSTLAIEAQLQGVNQQINEIESQILQTRTLIDYATIEVTVTETPEAAPLTMDLVATPKSGQSPLAVTFNAVVRGGEQPYLVNYNFGDGTSAQGQIVVHTYYQPGDYNVTATATDQNGTSVERWVEVHVTAVPGEAGVSGFFSTVSALFVSVVEGIVEVAAVVLPVAAVAAAVVIPLRRSRGRKPVAGSR
jgi:hypothetical protein